MLTRLAAANMAMILSPFFSRPPAQLDICPDETRLG
jgi:hypothetical protein